MKMHFDQTRMACKKIVFGIIINYNIIWQLSKINPMLLELLPLEFLHKYVWIQSEKFNQVFNA